MVDLDKKNKQILYELDLNARQSCSSIGKKINLHRNVIEYRINRLIDTGVIKNFYTIVDTSKLGYISFRCYLKFQNTNPEIEQRIIEDFVANKHTFWVSSIDGPYDLSFIIMVNNLVEFHEFWKNILKKYLPYIQDQIFSVYVKLLHYPKSYLTNQTESRRILEIIGGGEQVPIDEIECKILQILSTDARKPLTEIARQLNTTSMVINHRIKKMKKLGIIQGFRVNIDYTQLGYKHFKVDVYLMHYEKIDDIVHYIASNPHLIYIDYTAGLSELELEFHLQDTNELNKIMREMILAFPNMVKNFRYFIFSEIHKMCYMPKEK